MRKLSVAMLTSVYSVLLLTGCNDQGKRGPSLETPIPKELAGQWTSDDGKWCITVNEDGSIPWFHHPFGIDFLVSDGGAFVEKNKGSAEYLLGPCEASYNKETGQFAITVVMEYIRFDMVTAELEGNSTDEIIGTAHLGDAQWEGEWYSYATFNGVPIPKRELVKPARVVMKRPVTQCEHTAAPGDDKD